MALYASISAGIAQLVERDLAKVEATGSNPVTRSTPLRHKQLLATPPRHRRRFVFKSFNRRMFRLTPAHVHPGDAMTKVITDNHREFAPPCWPAGWGYRARPDSRIV